MTSAGGNVTRRLRKDGLSQQKSNRKWRKSPQFGAKSSYGVCNARARSAPSCLASFAIVAYPAASLLNAYMRDFEGEFTNLSDGQTMLMRIKLV